MRPTIRLVEGRTREIDWPDTEISAAEVPRRRRTTWSILQGVEPSLRWRRYCEAIVEVARELDASTVITLGSLLADVPHTRPVSITGIALRRRRWSTSSASSTRATRARPASPACSTTRARQPTLPSVSLWASVPHYVAAAPNPKVALALVRAFEGAAGVVVDAGELESAAEDYERQVSAAVASDPEVKAFVERLESAMDEVSEDEDVDPDNLPSADTIASDFQRFLRQRGPE